MIIISTTLTHQLFIYIVTEQEANKVEHFDSQSKLISPPALTNNHFQKPEKEMRLMWNHQQNKINSRTENDFVNSFVIREYSSESRD